MITFEPVDAERAPLPQAAQNAALLEIEAVYARLERLCAPEAAFFWSLDGGATWSDDPQPTADDARRAAVASGATLADRITTARREQGAVQLSTAADFYGFLLDTIATAIGETVDDDRSVDFHPAALQELDSQLRLSLDYWQASHGVRVLRQGWSAPTNIAHVRIKEVEVTDA